MAAPSNTATPAMGPIDHSPLLPTASDTRRQIIANALVEYPSIVQDHITNFDNMPVRAEDIFDVCVANVTGQYGSATRKYIAKLTHAHKGYPAARMLILSGRAMPTMESALHDLLEQSAHGLGVSLETLLPVREGCGEVTDGAQAGWALHELTADTGRRFAKSVRELAANFDMKKDDSPASESST